MTADPRLRTIFPNNINNNRRYKRWYGTAGSGWEGESRVNKGEWGSVNVCVNRGWGLILSRLAIADVCQSIIGCRRDSIISHRSLIKMADGVAGGAMTHDPNILFSLPRGRVYRPDAFHSELRYRVKRILEYLKDKKGDWEEKIFLQLTFWIGNRSFGFHKTTGQPIGLHQEYNGSHGRSVTLTFLLKENESVWKKQLEKLFFREIENTLKLLTQSTQEIYVIKKFRVTRVDSASGRYSPICH
jgi:hypothetical protein